MLRHTVREEDMKTSRLTVRSHPKHSMKEKLFTTTYVPEVIEENSNLDLMSSNMVGRQARGMIDVSIFELRLLTIFKYVLSTPLTYTSSNHKNSSASSWTLGLSRDFQLKKCLVP